MIELNVNNQKLEIKDTSYLVNKSNNYLTIKFDFKTDDWINRTKYCLIATNEQKTYQFLIEEDKITLPATVLKGKFIRISAYGVGEDNNRITTNQIRMKLAESGYTGNIAPTPEPARDVFQIIFEMLDTKVNLSDIDEELDIESNNPISNMAVANALNLKSDIGHTHSAGDVTGVDEVSGTEIKRAYQTLTNKIRTYGE